MEELTTQEVDRRLVGIAGALAADDPEFVRRQRRIHSREVLRVTLVVTMMVISAVLLAIGLAPRSHELWFVGVGCWIAASAVDHLLDGGPGDRVERG